MTYVPLKVVLELGIHPRADSGPFLVLGSSTRCLGTGSGYVLAPEFWYYDVSQWVQQLHSMQGRQDAFGDPQPGSVTATLENGDRRFDSRNQSGPYWSFLLEPTPQLRIWVDDVLWVTAYKDQHTPTYFDFNKALVDVGGPDYLGKLANHPVKWHARTQSTKSRVQRLLDHAEWTGPRDIAAGAFNMGAYDVDTDALSELAKYAQAEGVLFGVQPDTTFFWTDRSFTTDTPVWYFRDDGTGDADYMEITYDEGRKIFANQYDVTRRATNANDHPVTQSYSDEPSVNDNGRVFSKIDDCPVVDDLSAAFVAAIAASGNTRPIDRISSVSLLLADFQKADRQAMAAIVPGNVVSVRHHPVGGGTPAYIDQRSLVVGRELDVPDPENMGRVRATWYLKSLEAS